MPLCPSAMIYLPLNVFSLVLLLHHEVSATCLNPTRLSRQCPIPRLVPDLSDNVAHWKIIKRAACQMDSAKRTIHSLLCILLILEKIALIHLGLGINVWGGFVIRLVESPLYSKYTCCACGGMIFRPRNTF
jgi:hypothetical protein